MGKRRGEPIPGDPEDSRTTHEWKDKLGNVVRPGDYVTFRWGSGAIMTGLVHRIDTKRKDGRPFTHGKEVMHVVATDPEDGVSVVLVPEKVWTAPDATHSYTHLVDTGRLAPFFYHIRRARDECIKVATP